MGRSSVPDMATEDLPTLTVQQTRALEAFADTIIPGCKRGADDDAVAGVSATPGAVHAGALDVLRHPATGISDGIAEMADTLDTLARAPGGAGEADQPRSFADLPYERRRALVAELTSRANPERDFWFLLALFAYMAYDSSPHRPTAEVMRDAGTGLRAMGFGRPDDDGLWRFPVASYARELAAVHPQTDENGNLP